MRFINWEKCIQTIYVCKTPIYVCKEYIRLKEYTYINIWTEFKFYGLYNFFALYTIKVKEFTALEGYNYLSAKVVTLVL